VARVHIKIPPDDCMSMFLGFYTIPVLHPLHSPDPKISDLLHSQFAELTTVILRSICDLQAIVLLVLGNRPNAQFASDQRTQEIGIELIALSCMHDVTFNHSKCAYRLGL